MRLKYTNPQLIFVGQTKIAEVHLFTTTVCLVFDVSWFSAFSEFIFSNSVIRMDTLCTFSVWTNAPLPNRWLNMFFNCRSRLFGSKAKSAVEVGPGFPAGWPPQKVVIVRESYPKWPQIQVKDKKINCPDI